MIPSSSSSFFLAFPAPGGPGSPSLAGPGCFAGNLGFSHGFLLPSPMSTRGSGESRELCPRHEGPKGRGLGCRVCSPPACPGFTGPLALELLGFIPQAEPSPPSTQNKNGKFIDLSQNPS